MLSLQLTLMFKCQYDQQFEYLLELVCKAWGVNANVSFAALIHALAKHTLNFALYIICVIACQRI